MMFYVLRYREHPLFKLAQAPFLALMLGCATTATASTFVFLNLSKMACQLQGLLIYFPLSTVMAATLVGRLWRTFSAYPGSGTKACPVARGKQKSCGGGEWILDGLGMLANLHFLLFCKNPRERRYGLRAETTAVDLTRLIIILAILSLPQLIAHQVVGLGSDTPDLGLDSTESGLVSREASCACKLNWTTWVGVVYMMVVFGLALVVASVACNLPSILNESDAIFQACSITMLMAVVDILCIVMVSSPTTNPDVILLLWVCQTFGIVSLVVWVIV